MPYEVSQKLAASFQFHALFTFPAPYPHQLNATITSAPVGIFELFAILKVIKDDLFSESSFW